MRTDSRRHTRAAEIPRPGDLLVEQRRRSFILSVVPGSPQLSSRKSVAVLDLARRFAESRHVDCWFGSAGASTRIGRHRPLVAEPVMT